MSDAREVVLTRIRDRLQGIARPELPDPEPQVPAASEVALVEQFCSMLSSCGVTIHRVPDEAEAGQALSRIAGERGATEVACSDSPLIERCLRDEALQRFDGSADRQRLLESTLGVSGAQAGIAETGTLVLFNHNERHRLVSLVTPNHVAVLESSQLVGTLGAALALAAEQDGGPPPLVTFITGPSRTADIEMTLVVGVHGPEVLDVVLICRP